MARLYMYDVRGIQDYIFRTNKIKEIIGASYMVEDLIIATFNQAIEKYNKSHSDDSICYDKEHWKNSETLNFDFNSDSKQAEVVYYGGGNLLVLFSDESIGETISNDMCFNIIEETYSLQLAVASVEVTGEENYKEDYQNLRIEMERVKANMPMSMPFSGLPFTLNDPQTGLPLSKTYDGKKVSYESFKKLEKYDNFMKNKENGQSVLKKIIKDNAKSLIIDELSEDDNSLIAFVHIDGNGMGAFVKNKLAGCHTYKDATRICREISNEINKVFIDGALIDVEKQLETFRNKKEKSKNKAVFRPIISAGDDITFICRASIALDCVKAFMNALTGEFSACAGVYVTHSHFPFARAYEYAEELCSSAKELSRGKGHEGNYIDFQVNYSGILNNLETVRERTYTDVTGKQMYLRPYRIGKGNQEVSSIEELTKMIDFINDKTIARGKMKELRDAFYDGKTIVKKELERINSRATSDRNRINVENYQLLFDAIDVMDLKWGDKYAK